MVYRLHCGLGLMYTGFRAKQEYLYPVMIFCQVTELEAF
jgi:hypothetical protein